MSEQNNLGPGQCGADREVFERVWRRVMPEDRPDCPFTLYSEEETEHAPVRPTEEKRTELVPVPAEQSGGDGAVLQAFIADELSDWRTYQTLARRIPGGNGRALMGVAADERRHAGRLSAAYFLLSGVKFWPPAEPELTKEGWMAILRRRYWAERKGAEAYRTAAGRTGDSALRELYLELAGDEEAHAGVIRGILERM
ncbi:MAG: ferritin-like domain-containing protein [Pseudoflavonifractor capillosus]|uniref:ferritin-like domain-containing protein n=1 Tax=Pseudoflavonifractor capillosus TaxID=106588 RepID=UPI0023F86DAB|nr:ferritin-like domain-containing protein [Pseudoflavonifractor capillosus]MCI5927216.1 ferritin-like domain-containing protein [Pseudoflavonifractor capillosus]MDY4661648.1 ferritin-like domain-containing protein [Pseudoflavonifractor capillosus]